MRPANRQPTGLNRLATEPAALPALVRVGRLGAIHGLGGALRLRPDDPASETLQNVARVFLEIADRTLEYRLRNVSRINRTALRVAFEGLDDPVSAQALRGAILMVAVEDLPPVRPGEFYYFEAIGCEVTTQDGRRVGIVEEVFATGANDVWVVRDGASEVLVPVIENVVKAMDLGARRITIEAVPGLLG